MGLTERLIRYAAARPAAFVVTAPGGTEARLKVEAELRRRGLRMESSPAAAGLLVVCGKPGTELKQAINTVWNDLPGPRALVGVTAPASPSDIAALLDRGRAELADADAQRAVALARVAAGPWRPGTQTGDEAEGGSHHMEHGGHEHHMGAPAGLAMAERGADRDGLKLDQLHVRLGPILPDWPSGLVVATTLQGDVIQRAEISTMPGDGVTAFWDETTGRQLAAAHLDSLGRMLAVAGWADAAARARRLRDDVLGDLQVRVAAAEFEGFAGRVRCSRTLSWMLAGLGVIEAEAINTHGLQGIAARHPGDAWARLTGWLTEAHRAIVDPDARPDGPRGPVDQQPSAALLAVLPMLLEGAEFAAARLIVASLDPDLDQLAPVGADA